MRCFVATTLVVFAAVLCISHVDGSRDSEVKSVEKRQVPLPPERVFSSQDEPCDSTELQRRNNSLRCSNVSVGQQLLDVFAGCGFNDEALRKEQECGRDEMGTFCNEMENLNFTVNSLAQNIVSNRCGSRFFGTSCRERLQELRDSAGCCANYLLTNASLQLGLPIRNLWARYNLQRPDDCSSTLRFVQSQSEIVCSQQEIAYRLNRLFCDPDYITPFINILRSCRLEEGAQVRINRCGVNRYQRFCFEVENNASQLARDVFNRCSFSSGTCPVFCKSALERYRTGVDCCFNNLYNNTLTSTSLSDFHTTNYRLWSLCGVSNPGFCRNTVDNSTDVNSTGVNSTGVISVVNNSSVDSSDNSSIDRNRSSAHSVLLQVSVAATVLSAIFTMLI